MLMPQPFHPSLESLESRALLAGLVFPTEPLVPISTPLAASLSVSTVGSTEALTLTETNTSGHDTNVAIGCGVSDFWVTQGGVEVWRQSKDGPQPLCPISPGGILHAGQSRTSSATWDGHFNEATPPDPTGPFVFHGEVDGLLADASAPTDQTVSLTTDHAVYQVGQPIIMTLTRTNTSDHEINVEFGPAIDGFFVIQGGVEVWRSNLGPQPQALFIGLMPLKPGESFTQSATWDGRPNEGPSTTLTGEFEVHSEVQGANTVTIQIQPALLVSVTTERGSYRVGQPVHITINEAAPAALGGSTPRVTVSRQGVEVWKAPKRAVTTGEVRQYTLTWPGRFTEHPRTPRTGLFLIQATLDGATATTAIRIGRR
jgi:hypothetical protein